MLHTLNGKKGTGRAAPANYTNSAAGREAPKHWAVLSGESQVGNLYWLASPADPAQDHASNRAVRAAIAGALIAASPDDGTSE